MNEDHFLLKEISITRLEGAEEKPQDNWKIGLNDYCSEAKKSQRENQRLSVLSTNHCENMSTNGCENVWNTSTVHERVEPCDDCVDAGEH